MSVIMALKVDSMTTGGTNTMFFLLIIIVGLGIVIAIIVGQRRLESRMKGSSSLKGNVKGTSMTDVGAATQNVQQRNESVSYVKRCPTCKSIYTDETLAFCLSDGSTLERVAQTSISNDPNATLVYPEANRGEIPPTVQYHPDMPPNKKG